MSETQARSGKAERSWSPRMWLGCDFFAWLRIMFRGRFRFHAPHMHIGLVTSMVSLSHTVLKYVQNAIFRGRISRTRIQHAPVFIIGHWRTGTTLIHELMITDPRHSFPNTYQCMDPNHFLLTEQLFKKWLWFLLPERRPMDNMQVGWDRPQEDEFALCMLGQPSPYLDLVFPNRPPLTPGSLDLEGLTKTQKREWKRTFYRFLQTLTYRDPRRLILKSPPHSCRIPTLLELFPDARFIHIVRNPYRVFPSTVNLWRSLAEKHGVQTPHHREVKERVLNTFVHLYEKLEEGKKLIRPNRFHELRYEDLLKDPVNEMRRIYDLLELGDFDHARPHVESYLAKHSSYETNRFDLSDIDLEQVTERWGPIIRRYGYAIQSPKEASRDGATAPHRADAAMPPAILPFPTPAPIHETLPAAKAG